MPYTQIDPILFLWAETRGLYVWKEFKYKEARFIQIVDDAADSYGLWIEALHGDSSVNVIIAKHTINGSRVPTHKRCKRTFATTIVRFGQTLELAYGHVESWMRQKGHTRTPVF